MSDTNSGEPAFPSGLVDPSTPEDAVQSLHNGMTLRDYFAAKAMETLVHDRTPWDAAVEAYAYADAMLKARKK